MQLLPMMIGRSNDHHGYITVHDVYDARKGVWTLPQEDQPKFILCLFTTILVDQAMHAYGPQAFDEWKRRTGYPGWGILSGLNSSPWVLLDGFGLNLMLGGNLTKLANAAMQLFVDEVVEYFDEFLPEQSVKDFLQRIQSDPDVRGPWRNTLFTCLITALAHATTGRFGASPGEESRVT